MGTGSFIKQAFPRLIEATNDPTAPIKLQSAHGAVTSVAKMLIPKADRRKVDGYTKLLLNSWTDDQMNKVSCEPEFIIALASCLCEALVSYTKKIAGS